MLNTTSAFPYLDSNTIDDKFPLSSYRDGQKKCIEYAVNAFNSGKRIVILECPTGSGKSVIGMTLANMVNNSYYITITKILQDQLEADFPTIVNLKGRTAYPCTLYTRYGKELVRKSILSHGKLDEKLNRPSDCASGFCRSKISGGNIYNSTCSKCFLATPPTIKNASVKIPKGDLHDLQGNNYSACPYYEQVFKAIDSDQVLMNFSSFLYQTTLTKRFVNSRDLLIIDEAHNIESQILDFVSFSINDTMLQDAGIFIPPLEKATDYAIWFQKVNLPMIIGDLKAKAADLENYKEVDELDKLLLKYDTFVTHLSNTGAEWVVEYHTHNEKNHNYHSVTLKPVYAVDFVEDLLFKHGKKILLMSATILDVDVVCRSLGLNRSDIAAYRMRNRFPVENRPIFIEPAARMTGGKDKMEQWIPKLVKSVERIVDQYQGKRGIIHTHNFAIMDAIISRAKPSVAKRLLSQKDFTDKKEMLVIHSKITDSVIIAPAMHEGVNLSGDLSRFQIICKVPYANFYENKQLAKRLEVDPNYYTWITALKLIQSYGRSIRSEDDFADTYIIDAAISKFLSDAKNMLPSWFTDALRFNK